MSTEAKEPMKLLFRDAVLKEPNVKAIQFDGSKEMAEALCLQYPEKARKSYTDGMYNSKVIFYVGENRTMAIARQWNWVLEHPDGTLSLITHDTYKALYDER